MSFEHDDVLPASSRHPGKPPTPAQLRMEHTVLAQFVHKLGFDPKRVVAELAQEDDTVIYKIITLGCLRVERDFTATSFSERGIEEANKWLDGLRVDAGLDLEKKYGVHGHVDRGGD